MKIVKYLDQENNFGLIYIDDQPVSLELINKDEKISLVYHSYDNGKGQYVFSVNENDHTMGHFSPSGKDIIFRGKIRGMELEIKFLIIYT